MDSCQRFKEMMSEHIEGELDPQQKLLMEKHLRDCLGCIKTTRHLRSLIQNLKELPRLKVTPDFETILRARISLENGLARRRGASLLSSWQFRVPAYAVSALLIVLAVITILTRFNKPQRYYPPEAYMNQEWYGGTKQVSPSSNERVIYFIERKPIHNLFSQPPMMRVTDDPHQTSTSIDSTGKTTNQMNMIRTSQKLEPSIY